MRVLIDAHMVGERETGNETYIVNLLRGLTQVAGDDEYCVAAAHADLVAPLVAGNGRFRVVPVSSNPIHRLLRDLPALSARLKPDVLFVTYAGPLTSACPMVVAVHDVSFRRHPEWFSPRDRLVLKLGVGLTMRRAAAVITLSNFSKREIASFYPVPAERIHVTPLAPASYYGPEGRTDTDVHGRLAIRRPYVLAVGNMQPRKNLLRLIEAFARCAQRPNFAHDLVLVGKDQRQGSALDALVGRLGLSERVRSVGYVDGEDLPAIYRGADLFVYPSLYEGFGLPVLEAMACGTPVLASNVPAIQEVAGDAARLVDPLSVDDLAAAIGELCSHAGQRAAWGRKGLAHSRTFTWERTATQTRNILHSVVS